MVARALSGSGNGRSSECDTALESVKDAARMSVEGSDSTRECAGALSSPLLSSTLFTSPKLASHHLPVYV